MTQIYDAIIVGAGHAGIEACLSVARTGYRTLLLTMDLDTIGKMSCNPAVGGIAKGHMVREIDALGGEMGKATDATALQFRMLNRSKGPAVWAPRAQSDKWRYSQYMKHTVENCPNLSVRQELVDDVIVENGVACGVRTKSKNEYRAQCVVLTTGTFLSGIIHMGKVNYSGGRNGEKSAMGLTEVLINNGIESGRFKTGTPPRINKNSIDFSKMKVQPGENPPLPFSFSNKAVNYPQLPCHITYTSEKTHDIIRGGLADSPMYSGRIKGVGPRYCPSFEDKVVRFADKEAHQLYIEPEGWNTNETYINGFSTSLSQDVQEKALRTIPGLENADFMRYGYAVEYDYFIPTQLHLSLETKLIKNLFFAGQINGTTGYEEAGAQGLMAGLNVIRKLKNEEPFILKRSEAYVGILIDDLVTKGTNEPYRMFTSLAEFRLILRQDNADLRLMKYGYDFGLITDQQYDELEKKEKEIAELEKYLNSNRSDNLLLSEKLRRQDTKISDLINAEEYDEEVTFQTELNVKYEPYIKRQMAQMKRFERSENVVIPEDFDFSSLAGARKETIEKLTKLRPESIGQASRIPGISQPDLSLLLVKLKKEGISVKN